jgi:lipopolysaccharide assembly protein B
LARKLPSAGTPRTIRKGDQVDFDLQWLLLALPITFGLGWLASRFDWRQMQRDEQRSPKAYFKGLTHLLNEQPDEAIDAFIEVVQNDPDTSELHFALGNLFRKRGEFERAVRVHQHLLARADLKVQDRERAQYALAQDYMRAGLFDRAESAFTQLLSGPHKTEAQFALLQLHERARNWAAATETAQALNLSSPSAYDARIAHHWCERAQDHAARNELDQAQDDLARARAASPESLRAQVQTAQLLAQAGEHDKACDQWQSAMKQHPQAVDLIAPELARAAQATGRQAQVRAALEAAYAESPSLDLLDAWALLVDDPATVQARYAEHLSARPSVAAVAAVAAVAPAAMHEAVYLQTLQRAAAQARRYRCAACGFESQLHFWQCPGCLSWDSFPPARVEDR